MLSHRRDWSQSDLKNDPQNDPESDPIMLSKVMSKTGRQAYHRIAFRCGFKNILPGANGAALTFAAIPQR